MNRRILLLSSSLADKAKSGKRKKKKNKKFWHYQTDKKGLKICICFFWSSFATTTEHSSSNLIPSYGSQVHKCNCKVWLMDIALWTMGAKLWTLWVLPLALVMTGVSYLLPDSSDSGHGNSENISFRRAHSPMDSPRTIRHRRRHLTLPQSISSLLAEYCRII